MSGIDEPFFSVIIPSYNRQSILPFAIQSVLDQNFSSFEIIVVDDGSTDKTEDAVQRFLSDKRVKYFKINNLERAAARNFGVSKSHGQYVSFLDSDDIYYGSFLTRAYRTIQENGFPGFVHLSYEEKDAKGRKISENRKIVSGDIFVFVEGNPFSCMCVLLRRDVAQVFKFNEDRDLSGSEDWELWLRISANYGFVQDNHIGGALIHHDDRSVLNIDPDKLELRKTLAIQYAFADEAVVRKFSTVRTKMLSFSKSYVALHLAMAGHRSKAFYCFGRAVTLYPPIIFRKRCLAILKYLLFV